MRRVKVWVLSSLPLLFILSGLALPAVCQEQPAMLWVKTFDGGSSDQARDVAVDSMDNIVVTGVSVKGTDSYMTVKYDGNGNQVWNRTYEDGDQAHSVAVDSEDNILVTGFSFNGYTDSFLTIKYDEDGNMLWSRMHGEEWQGEGVATDSRNNVIVVGYYYVEDVMGQWDIQIVKCDSNGNQIWSRTYDDLEGERAFDVAVDSNDNIVITGMSYDGMTRNLIAIKYDKNGNLLWTRTYNGGYEDEGHGVAVDSMDNIVVTGFTSDSTTNRSFLTIKYDEDGNMLWTKTNREELQDEAYSVAVDSNDNILVTGWSFDGTTRKLKTIEYDRDGNQLWITSYEGSPTHGSLVEVWGYGVAVDSMDNIVVTGAIFFIKPQKLSDFFTVKYGSESINLPPVVSDPSPLDGAEGVKVDLSTLSFSISDPENGLMEYYVAIDPDVGSVERIDQSSGRYSIPLSAPLSHSTTYKWQVSVTDGTSWTNETFTFTTEPEIVNTPPIVSDPSPPDGATVSTSLSELSFTISDPEEDLMDYYVTTTPDIGEDSDTGVGDGTYLVSVSVKPEATYAWQVSVTDGTSWTNATYGFLAVSHVETYGFNVVQEDVTHHVIILSNSSVSSFAFDQTQKLISFDVTGPLGTRGSCDVTFPKELLDSPFEVTVNDRSIAFVLTQNATHNSLQFSYTHSTQTIRITGTTVEPGTTIPEFYISILIVVVCAITAVTIFYLVRMRKKRERDNKKQ